MADDFKITAELLGVKAAIDDIDKGILDYQSHLINSMKSTTDASKAMEMLSTATAAYTDAVLKIQDSKGIVTEDMLNSVNDLKSALIKIGLTEEQVTKELEKQQRLREKATEEEKKRLALIKNSLAMLQTVGNSVLTPLGLHMPNITSAKGFTGDVTSMLMQALVKAYNTTSMIGAGTRQAAMQWSPLMGGPAARGMASENIGFSRWTMMKSLEESITLQRKLSLSGLSGAALNASTAPKAGLNLAKEMEVEEVTKGYDIMQHTADLLTMINQSTDQRIQKDETIVGLAESYVDTLDEVTKRIPQMNMGQMRKEWVDITSSVKAYNTSMLTTMQMLTVLSDKNVAQKVFGLGEAPLQVRQSFAKAVMTMTEGGGTPTGVRAELGKRLFKRAKNEGRNVGSFTGGSLEDLVYFFSEGANTAFGDQAPIARLQEGLRMILERVGAGTTGSKLRFRLEQGLQLLGPEFGGPGATRLAASIAGSSDIQRRIKAGTYGSELGTAFEGMKGEGERIRKAALLKEGMDIAVKLRPIEDRIKNWIEERLIPIFEDIRESLLEMRASGIDTPFGKLGGGDADAKRQLQELRKERAARDLAKAFKGNDSVVFAQEMETLKENVPLGVWQKIKDEGGGMPASARADFIASMRSSDDFDDRKNFMEAFAALIDTTRARANRAKTNAAHKRKIPSDQGHFLAGVRDEREDAK